MWLHTGLIVIIITNGVAAFQLSCMMNYLSVEAQGVTVYMGEGGDEVDVFKELVNNCWEMSWSIIDRNAKPSLMNIEFPGNYLILSGDSDFEDTVSQAVFLLSSDMNRWNPGARMIVVLNALTKLERVYSVVPRIITNFWNHMVYDTMVFITSGDSIQQMYTASPFDEGNECGLHAKKLRNLTCGGHEYHGHIWHHPDVYPNCSFKVSRRQAPPFSFYMNRNHFVKVFTEEEWYGSDVQFVRLLSAKKKLHVLWSERPSPESDTKAKEVHRYYKNFSRDGIDLAIGGNVIMSKYMYTVAYLRAHDQHNLLYYVADADQMRGWPILHTMFTVNTWLVLGLAVVLAGLVYSMLKDGKFDVTRIRLNTVFAILVTQNISQPTRWRLRLLLVSLMLPLYHISSLYLTTLQSFMLHTPLNKPLVLESDLRAANLTVYVADSNRFFIMEKNSNQHFEKYTDSLGAHLLQLDRDRNIAVLARSLEANFFISSYQLRVHQLREGIAVLPVCMAMGKGNVYFAPVDNLVQQCLEVGLFAKWIRDLTQLNVRKPRLPPARAALDFTDLECAFLLLTVGYLAATSVFLSEQLLHRWKTRIRRQSRKCVARQHQDIKQKFKYYVIEKDK